MNDEQRFIEIEIKLSRQEDLVDTLNQMVYEQQKKIDRLDALCSALMRQLNEARSSASEGSLAHDRPPHY